MNVHSVQTNVLKTVRIQLEATFVIVMQDLFELSMVMTVKVSVHALVSCVQDIAECNYTGTSLLRTLRDLIFSLS